jgi:hypothetical protein
MSVKYTNLTNVKINGNVNLIVTLPGTEKDIEKFLSHEEIVDYSFENDNAR